MYFFESLVNRLRHGILAFGVAVVIYCIFFFFGQEMRFKMYCYMVYSNWQIANHDFLNAEVNACIFESIAWALAFGMFGTIGSFVLWVICTSRLDLTFDDQAFLNLLQSFFFIGFARSATILAIDPYIPLILGASILFIETKRMRVLAATY